MRAWFIKAAATLLVAGMVLAGGSYAEKKDKPDKAGSETSVKDKDRPGPSDWGRFGRDDRERGRGWKDDDDDRGGPGGRGFGMGGPGFHGDLFSHPEVQKKLDLTQDQVVALKKNRTELEKRRIKLEADLEIARIEMMELLKAEELDNSAIDKQVEILGDLHKQQVRGMIDHIVSAHKILDATQLEQVRGFVHRMHERWGEGGPPWRDDREEHFRRFREDRGRGPQGPPDGERPRKGPRFGEADEPGFAPGPPQGPPPFGGPGQGDRFGQGRPPMGPPPGGFPPADPNSLQQLGGPGSQEGFADLGPGLGQRFSPGPGGPQHGR